MADHAIGAWFGPPILTRTRPVEQPEAPGVVGAVAAHADALSEAVGVLGGVLDAMTVRLATVRTPTNGSPIAEDLHEPAAGVVVGKWAPRTCFWMAVHERWPRLVIANQASPTNTPPHPVHAASTDERPPGAP